MIKHADNILPYLLGAALAIMPVQRVYFVAVSGLAVVLFVSTWITYTHIREIVRIPKILLTLTIALVLLAAIIPGATAYARMYILGMFCVFFASYILGPKVLISLGIGSIIGGMSVLVVSVLSDFERSGGIYHLVNYNQATGAILLGTILWRWKYQWLLIPVALVGALFTGADEAFVVVAVLGLLVLLRKDVSWRVIPSAAVVLIPLIVLLLPSNPIQRLWATIPASLHVLQGRNTEVNSLPQIVRSDWNNRWNAIVDSLHDVRILGHGYQPDNVKWQSIHNVPVRVLHELGPLGLLIWLALMAYGLCKTSWKYAFIAITSMSLFDHFIWTQLTPYFFVLLGVCTWLPNKSDRIFKA